MKIDNNNGAPKRSSDKKPGKFDKLKFWQSGIDADTDTFSSKREKADKARKRKIITYVALGVLGTGTLIG